MNTLRDNMGNVTFGLYIGQSHRLSLEVVLTCIAKFAPSTKVLIVDNESGHQEFLKEKFVPFHSCLFKKSKTEILNWMFKNCETRYLVLLETDVLFLEHLFDLEITHDIHAHIIPKEELARSIPQMPSDSFSDCIGVGLIVLDVESLRSKGIFVFDDENDRKKDFLGSWILEKSLENGVTIQELYPPSDDFDPKAFFIDQDYFIRYYTNHTMDDAEVKVLDDQTDQILRYYLSEQVFEDFVLKADSFEPAPVKIPLD
jgi:hypothetical protein